MIFRVPFFTVLGRRSTVPVALLRGSRHFPPCICTVDLIFTLVIVILDFSTPGHCPSFVGVRAHF